MAVHPFNPAKDNSGARHVARATQAILTDVVPTVINGVNTLVVTLPAIDRTRRDLNLLRYELERQYGSRFERIKLVFTGADF